MCGKAAMNRSFYSKGYTTPIHGLYEQLTLPIGPDHDKACPIGKVGGVLPCSVGSTER